jgi:hypothetical protein
MKVGDVVRGLAGVPVYLQAVMYGVALVLFPPTDRRARDCADSVTTIRFWSRVNEVVRDAPPRGRIVRALKSLPAWLGYRAVLVPYFVFCQMKGAWNIAHREVATRGLPLTTINRFEHFARILVPVLRYPGLTVADARAFSMPGASDLLMQKGANNLQIQLLFDVLPTDKPRRSMLVNDKQQLTAFAERHGLPCVPILAVFSANQQQGFSEADLPKGDLFVKPSRGTMSRGAARIVFDHRSGTYEILRPIAPLENSQTYADGRRSPSELISALRDIGTRTTLLLQPYLHAHPKLVALTGSESLSTIRVISAKRVGGEPRILGAYLRLPSRPGASETFTNGGIACSVGAAGQILHATYKYWPHGVSVHPFSGAPLTGFIVPAAKEGVAACAELHAHLAKADPIGTPIIGFDVAIHRGGFSILEANCPCDLEFQKLTGPYWGVSDFVECFRSHLAMAEDATLLRLVLSRSTPA